MKLYSENKNYKLYQGNMLDMLEVIDKESIDAVLTDPPYELNFMGKGWDNAGVSFNADTWKKCFEVLKPGGYLLAFGGSRTVHRIACAIEDAGFEIRDTIMWLYGSGFPKSMNLGLAIDKKNGIESIDTGIQSPNARPNSDKTNTLYESGIVGKDFTIKKATNKWEGWGTCLKPSFEPIIVARKPFKGSLVDNVIEYGVGGINIDECRVGNEKLINKGMSSLGVMHDDNWISNKEVISEVNGRFPANTILTYDETDFDEVCGGFPYTKSTGGSGEKSKVNTFSNVYKGGLRQGQGGANLGGLGDSGSASRYFYCAKASKKDRDEGLDNFEEKQKYYCDGRGNSLEIFGSTDGGRKPLKNIHPTVKPTELMQYLVRLVTPNGGTILDPFNGSGSTGKAVMYENKERNKGYRYIGIELTEEYLPIAQARIEHVCKDICESNDDKFDDLD